MLPPLKRVSKFLAFGYILVKPLQWLRDVFFDSYAGALTYSDWDISTSYSIGDKVKYTDYCSYISLTNSNLGNVPTDTVNWYLISNDYVGLRQRSNFTGQKLLLEYALNKHYSTTFNQPPTLSDIYITTNLIDVMPFTTGSLATNTSSAALNSATAQDFVGTSYTYDTISLTINVPNATLNTIIGGEVAPYPKAKQSVLTYSQKLIFAGIEAEVVGY
jgi:hypothetical protein